MSTERNIVIIGGGIIGCTSAYYLTHHPSYSPETTSVTILEASSVAGGASGKAGGLVAKWAYPRELVDITFGEHERLAKEHRGAERWGWRYTNVGQWEGRGEDIGSQDMTSKVSLNKKDGLHTSETIQDSCYKGVKKRLPGDLDWVKEELTESYEPMAGGKESAQVHPYQFTTSMCALAQEKGAKLIIGKATNIIYTKSEDSNEEQALAVSGVSYVDSASGEIATIPATHVLVSAGPWTQTILPKAPITGTRAHSITVRPTRPVSAYCLFTDITMPNGRSATPEIYARPNNEVYACSPGDGLPLPASTAEVQVDTKVCDALFEQVAAISPEVRGGEVTVKQACYLPNVNSGPRGCPIVGADHMVKGLVIAAGHTCWGICNAPGTARAVSELIMDGKISCGNLSRLAPRNFF
ncbi:FAD dependent oxidoreductase [Fomitiporia mediterranea MF3/22]|uniref:FAD dependent oxidoreductase n=1 Tax=Fomitiporia mediterranea (strain MF3/22) TaxID=694068 RepID=UPI0004408F17|nr:FAD dependent oxidoreductase [Fomitiporia mediterranea MF3/22]EJC98772.1 FAD dependent oxidoreductase [Fomitiporia mediterranea MF3/22]